MKSENSLEVKSNAQISENEGKIKLENFITEKTFIIIILQIKKLQRARPKHTRCFLLLNLALVRHFDAVDFVQNFSLCDLKL